MNTSEYKINTNKSGASVIVGNVRYPFCSIESAVSAVASNNHEQFVAKFRGFEEYSEN